MPGREDFAIIRARLVADERAHKAAAEYVACGLAVEATSLSTVVGHIAQLSLWAMRETNSGILPGDGVSTIGVATLSPRSVAQEVAKCLISAGLLRAKGTGLYIAGFRDCYSSIVAKRKADRARVASKREEQKSQRSRGDVAATSERRSGDVASVSQRTVPCRAVPDRAEAEEKPPSASGGSSKASPLTDKERDELDAACRAIHIDRKASIELKRRAAAVFNGIRDESVSPADARAFYKRDVAPNTDYRCAAIAAKGV
jgi:hypothetical protein